MVKRRWNGRASKTVARRTGIDETALEGMGRRQWSDAHQKLMSPSKAKRIDPNSPEGQAIAARYAKEGQQD